MGKGAPRRSTTACARPDKRGATPRRPAKSVNERSCFSSPAGQSHCVPWTTRSMAHQGPNVRVACACSLVHVEWADFDFKAPGIAFAAFRPMVAFPVRNGRCNATGAIPAAPARPFSADGRFAPFRPFSADFPAHCHCREAACAWVRGKRRRGRNREIVPRECAPAGTSLRVSAVAKVSNLARKLFFRQVTAHARGKYLAAFSRPPFCGALTVLQNWDGQRNGRPAGCNRPNRPKHHLTA